MTARFDLARLIAATTVARDDRGRVELRFHYPSSPTGQPALRRVRHPALLHTRRDGWALRGHDLLRDAPRTFSRPASPPRPLTLPPTRQRPANRPEEVTHRLRRRPHPHHHERSRHD